MERKKLLEVAHVSVRGTSFRITLPRKIVQRLNLSEGDIVGFYDDDGIRIDKIE